jgi:putative hemolysin
VVRRSEGEYELDGDMVITDFLELLGIDEDSFEAESETVGGWTVESFGAFPQVGDRFRYENWEITVLAMDGRRVEKVLVKSLLPEPEEDDK